MPTETEHRVAVGPWTIKSVTVEAKGAGGERAVGERAVREGANGDGLGPARPTVVLVHGLGMSGRSLLPTARLLARRFRVIIPDLPGTGASTRPSELLDVDGLAEALIGWLDAVDLGPVPLVGHSLGCQIAVHAAGRHPDRVSSLVLVSPSRDPLIGAPWRKAVLLLLDGPRESPGLLLVAVTDYLRAGPLRMWRTLKAAMQTDPVRALGAVRQPTLVVRGDRDLLVTAWWARTITRLVHDGREAVIPGPHGLPYSAPHRLARVIGTFLAEQPPCPARGSGRPRGSR